MAFRLASPLSLLALLTLSACTAKWSALVRYSQEPAPASEPPVVSLYVAVLQSSLPPDQRELVLAPQPASDTALWPIEVGTTPSHWADTLKREVHAALFDADLGRDAPAEAVVAAARVLGLRVSMDTSSAPISQASAVAVLQLSKPGFNSDSTIAAVRLRPLGGWCGQPTRVLLLARRPGLRWRVWWRS